MKKTRFSHENFVAKIGEGPYTLLRTELHTPLDHARCDFCSKESLSIRYIFNTATGEEHGIGCDCARTHLPEVYNQIQSTWNLKNNPTAAHIKKVQLRRQEVLGMVKKIEQYAPKDEYYPFRMEKVEAWLAVSAPTLREMRGWMDTMRSWYGTLL